MREPGSAATAGPAADADGLDGRNRHQRLGEPAVELAVPLHVAAEPGRHAAGDDLEAAAHRVARLARRDRSRRSSAARPRDRRSAAASRRESLARPRTSPPADRASDAEPIDTTWLTISASTSRKQLARDRADGHARGRLARARALEHVADVVVAVLHDARQIGVAGPRPRDDRPIDARGVSRAAPTRPPSSAASSPSPCSESAARSGRRS